MSTLEQQIEKATAVYEQENKFYRSYVKKALSLYEDASERVKENVIAMCEMSQHRQRLRRKADVLIGLMAQQRLTTGEMK